MALRGDNGLTVAAFLCLVVSASILFVVAGKGD
jgi:hypothetical protein